ncbi:MAG: hypothetical protein JXB13_13300 [Phycisphaerae bacterium]|nr:hypothetical protein [Phycisphaerae bacterium]
MTQPYSNSPTTTASVAARVRSNAVNALLPAVLITLIGWLMFKPLENPSGVKETIVAGTIWILRFAGPVLLMTACIGRATGRLLCFLLDAVVSSCVALALALTVVVISDELVKANLPVLIFAVFAAVYVRAAWSLWREYFVLRRVLVSAGPQSAALAPAPPSSAGTVESTAREVERPRPSPLPEAGGPSGKRREPPVEPPAPAPEQPPPDGFLAGFADRRPGEDEER